MSQTLVSNEGTRPRSVKRASYRLFPVAAPTPPASPVFARLSQNVDALERRSSSVPYGLNSPATPQRDTTTSLPTLNIRAVNHGDDEPTVRPKSTRVEVKVEQDHCRAHRPPFASARNPDAINTDRLSRSKSAPREETRSTRNAAPTMAPNSATSTFTQPQTRDLTSIFPLAPTFTSDPARKGMRSKPKPNLRINVDNDAMEDLPPPPPPKSPRRLPTPPSGSSRIGTQSPLSGDQSRPGLDGREPRGQSPAIKERPSRKLLPQFLSSGSPNVAEKASPVVRKPVSRLNSGASDPSPDTALDASLQIPSIRSASPISFSNSESAVDDSQQKRYVAYRPPTAPHVSGSVEQLSEKATPLQWTSRSHSPQTLANMDCPIPSDPTTLVSRFDGPRSASPADNLGSNLNDVTVRRVVNAGPLNSNPYIPSDRLLPASHPTVLEPKTFSRSTTASPIRPGLTNTAASANPEIASSESPERPHRNHTSPPELPAGAFSRAITPEAPSTASRGSSIAFMDPVERLKELTGKCEVLHAKYASLRADRQKISGGIISSLKAAKPDATALSALLDDQLSLVSVSSATDICFAKLQALECQKEDAVAALIAQLGSLKRTTVDSIAGSPARNITHPRNQPFTLEPLARSGRLTPEYADTDRFLQPNRLLVESDNLRTPEIESPSQDATPRADGQRSPLQFPPTLGAWPRSDSVISGDLSKRPALEHELTNVDEEGHEESTSALEEILPGNALDEGTRKLRVDGPRAARILGMIARSDSRKASSSARVPVAFEDMLLRKQPELELEISSAVKPHGPRRRGPDLQDGVSPTTSPDEDVDPFGLTTRPIAATHYLSRRPSTPTAEPALPVLPSARYGSPIKEPPLPPSPDQAEAPSSPKSLKSVKSFKSIKSYKSTKKGYLHQTIKVFMDDDILEYYRALQGWSQST